MQTLKIKTNIYCPPSQLEYRRKDIITQAIDVLGRDGSHDLFHNHKGEKAVHRYPLIQYRVHGNKLHLLALGEGVPALLKVIIDAEMDNPAHRINLNNVEMTKGKAEMKASEKWEYYRLMDWVALNNKNFNEKWLQSYSLIERVGILNEAITGHLRRMRAAIHGSELDIDLNGELYMITGRKPMKIYGNKMMGLNVIFKTKAHLPEELALGRCISLGTGTYQKLKNNPEQNKRPRIIDKETQELAEKTSVDLSKIVL